MSPLLLRSCGGRAVVLLSMLFCFVCTRAVLFVVCLFQSLELFMKMFCVRDSAINSFNNPFCAPTPGFAERSFRDEVNREESPMHAHPEDYELYQVGEFDADSGVITPVRPVSICRAQDVLR